MLVVLVVILVVMVVYGDGGGGGGGGERGGWVGYVVADEGSERGRAVVREARVREVGGEGSKNEYEGALW